jgi:hypothetical protein
MNPIPRAVLPLRLEMLDLPPETPDHRLVRSTIEGRVQIAAEIARLRRWCESTETPWAPPSKPSTPGGW